MTRTERFPAPEYVVHDVIGEWELDRGYDILATDRHDLAVMLVRALGESYGTTRIFNDHFVLVPSERPLRAA